MVEALCYKLEGHGFDSQYDKWNFSLTILLAAILPLGSIQPLTNVSGVPLGDEGGQCIGLTSPSSRADCLEILEA